MSTNITAEGQRALGWADWTVGACRANTLPPQATQSVEHLAVLAREVRSLDEMFSRMTTEREWTLGELNKTRERVKECESALHSADVVRQANERLRSYMSDALPALENVRRRLMHKEPVSDPRSVACLSTLIWQFKQAAAGIVPTSSHTLSLEDEVFTLKQGESLAVDKELIEAEDARRITRHLSDALEAEQEKVANLVSEKSQPQVQNEDLKKTLASMNDAVNAQPWATDEPLKVQLDRLTQRLTSNDGWKEVALSFGRIVLVPDDAQPYVETVRRRLSGLMNERCDLQRKVSDLHAELKAAKDDHRHHLAWQVGTPLSSSAEEYWQKVEKTGMAHELQPRTLVTAAFVEGQIAGARLKNDTPTPGSSRKQVITPPPYAQALWLVLAELGRAQTKFPTWPTDPIHAAGVLFEEAGELVKEVMQLTYEPHKSSREKVATEAVQCAAMGLRFVQSLERYVYTAAPQHSQTTGGAR